MRKNERKRKMVLKKLATGLNDMKIRRRIKLAKENPSRKDTVAKGTRG